jgi:hypothetical protein
MGDLHGFEEGFPVVTDPHYDCYEPTEAAKYIHRDYGQVSCSLSFHLSSASLGTSEHQTQSAFSVGARNIPFFR